MAKPTVDQLIDLAREKKYDFVRESHEKWYGEHFAVWCEGKEMVSEVPLCNRFGFPVPKERLISLTRRKKDDLWVAKFKDHRANSHILDDIAREAIQEQKVKDKAAGLSPEEISDRARWMELQLAEPSFEEVFATSWNGKNWFHSPQRKLAVQAAESAPPMLRLAWAAEEADEAQDQETTGKR